ncbi:MAG: N-formylglutamate amidohydrolase [Bacteroidia bacterium]|nr:N-formylglutamate amidohydrolase [Bacteroidia bacterium]
MSEVFQIIEPKSSFVPVLLSIPHLGTEFPEEVRNHYVEELAAIPDDTDFYLDQLYDFASEIGITIIQARYSRWLIDLNRDPQNVSLYKDGRMITGLCPRVDFKGNAIYKSTELEPDEEELNRRKDAYYFPYHKKISEILQGWRKEHTHVLLWDAHSIRAYVKSIQQEKFPQLILGNNDRKSADGKLIDLALRELGSLGHELTHNHPFKGGYITRSKGDPENGIHALQLEMIKTLYMDDAEILYHEERAGKLKPLLKNTLLSLSQLLKSL